MIFSNHWFNILILILLIIKCKCKLISNQSSFEEILVTTVYNEQEEKDELVKNITHLNEFDSFRDQSDSLTTVTEDLFISNLEKVKPTTVQSSKDAEDLTIKLDLNNEERSESNNQANDTSFLTKSEKKKKSKPNPSVDDIISGIIQLIGGNVKLGRPNQKHQPPQIGQPLGRPLILPYPGNPTLINNRNPPSVEFAGSAITQHHNLLPPSVLIGHDLPAGLPIPLPPNFHYQIFSSFSSSSSSQPSSTPSPSLSSSLNIIKNGPLYNSLLTDLSFSIIDDNKLQNKLSSSPKQWSSSNFLSASVFNAYNLSNASSFYNVISTPTLLKNSKVNVDNMNKTKSIETVITTIDIKTMAQSNKEIDKFLLPIYSSKLDPFIIDLIDNSSLANSNSKETTLLSSESTIPSGPVTAWLPFFSQLYTTSKKNWLKNPPSIITKPEMPSTFDVTVKHKIGPSIELDKSSLTSHTSLPSAISSTFYTSGLKNSLLSSDIKPTGTLKSSQILQTFSSNPEIFYGRPEFDTIKNDHSKIISPSFTTGHIKLLRESSTFLETNLNTKTEKSFSTPILGHPIVIPVKVEHVKPQLGLTPSVITEPGKGSVFIDGKATRFKIRPNVKSEPTLQVGSNVRINTVNENQNLNTKQVTMNKNFVTRPSVIRRPGFRPRPSTPLVRIDTCIVGDDTTCGSNLNEHCKTEMGISSCQCKPGFGRLAPRSACTPVITLSILFRVDRLGDNKLVFNNNLQNSETEEYQYLEYESLLALNSIFNESRLGKFFKGAKVNKFSLFGGKTMVNATIELDKTNTTQSLSIKRVVQQEMARLIASRNNNIGNSQLWVDGTVSVVPRVDDINECSNLELNDCSKFALCFNEFGSFKCVCKVGYEDKFFHDQNKAGRYCISCSPAYCSNRGECFNINGEKECKCKGNFIGSKCDIDGEVLGLALGGSVAALIIIIITFLCLYMWNQRWKNDLQKIEAMSAESGHTFICVNKQQAANYRCSLDERTRWATVAHTLPMNANYNYYVNPEHLMTTSQQHVYSTPCRVQTPDALLNDDLCTMESRSHPRTLRSKSRASLGPSYQQGYGPGSIYNETEFSTRETIYAPSHFFIPSRSKYSIYN